MSVCEALGTELAITGVESSITMANHESRETQGWHSVTPAIGKGGVGWPLYSGREKPGILPRDNKQPSPVSNAFHGTETSGSEHPVRAAV